MLDPTEFGKAMGGIVREAVAPLLKRIEELEARQLERGEKGEPGEPGQDADPISLADVCAELLATDGLKTLIDLHVAEAVAALPVPENGKDGERGPQGERGADGAKGDAGEDGEGLAAFIINRDGELVASTTKGNHVVLGEVVGKDGAPGRDGADGLGFDDIDVEYDGERTFTIKWQRGEVVKSKTFDVPTIIDRGYWREGMASKAGDVVTQDGSAWVAKQDNTSKPCLENKDDWRLFARKGRDGAQGPAGKAYVAPAPVRLGDGNG